VIHVLVVDHHPVIGEGLRALLGDEPEFSSVETATDTESAMQIIATGRPDVVVCEVQLKGANGGLLLLRQNGETRPAFIMFSAQTYPAAYRAALEGGAAGFISKTAPLREIVRAIRIVAAGGRAFSAAALDGARSARRRPTARELQIVDLISTGATNAEIAYRLAIRRKTVESELRRLFNRYAVPNRTALAHLAEREGWLVGGP
jgi:DNA-binding NarL/FixJ family response regulator